MIDSTHKSHHEITKRLKRAEGHLRTIIDMIDGQSALALTSRSSCTPSRKRSVPLRRRLSTTTSIIASNGPSAPLSGKSARR
jgi:hypothetical protein